MYGKSPFPENSKKLNLWDVFAVDQLIKCLYTYSITFNINLNIFKFASFCNLFYCIQLQS